MRLDPQARRELEDALFDALDENELHRVVRRALKVEIASITAEGVLQDAISACIGKAERNEAVLQGMAEHDRGCWNAGIGVFELECAPMAQVDAQAEHYIQGLERCTLL